ncbi:MAG: hypothetical protein M1833_000179 [Piccolia ochrophora]|nr:MAG: hypothetical protein M1833_000179 [Piccolia ochrophora]
MTLQKNEGRFCSAALSNNHLVAITDKHIRVCNFQELEGGNLPECHKTTLAKDTQTKCVAISQNSKYVAVGQRHSSSPSTGHTFQSRGVIQLYNIELTARDCLQCPPSQPLELPKHLAFARDGDALFCGSDSIYHAWVRFGSRWQSVRLGQVVAKNNVGGCQGITSITPLSTTPSKDIRHLDDGSVGGPSSFTKNYFIVTSILSSVRDNTGDFISALSRDQRLVSPYPSSGEYREYLHASASSPRGDLAAFLSSEGDVKVVQLVPQEAGVGLRMVPIAQALGKVSRDSPERAGKVKIREDGGDYEVLATDRYGKVARAKIVMESIRNAASFDAARTMEAGLRVHSSIRNPTDVAVPRPAELVGNSDWFSSRTQSTTTPTYPVPIL